MERNYNKHMGKREEFESWYENYHDIYQLDKRVTYLECIIEDLDLEKRHECPICGERCVEFIPFGSLLYEREQCPNCGSLSRQRSLYLIMKREIDLFNKTNDINILHFAPEPSLYQLFDEKENINYVTADLDKAEYKKELYFFVSGKTAKYYENPQDFIKEEIDVQSIPFEDNSFDYVIINHVLEHVPNDRQAMREICRILKPEGIAFISVPVEGEITNEDERINTPELRLKYYMDPTHLRLYGRDIKERLESCGFEVEEYDDKEYFSKEERDLYGIHKAEILYLCRAKK